MTLGLAIGIVVRLPMTAVTLYVFVRLWKLWRGELTTAERILREEGDRFDIIKANTFERFLEQPIIGMGLILQAFCLFTVWFSLAPIFGLSFFETCFTWISMTCGGSTPLIVLHNGLEKAKLLRQIRDARLPILRQIARGKQPTMFTSQVNQGLRPMLYQIVLARLLEDDMVKLSESRVYYLTDNGRGFLAVHKTTGGARKAQ